MKEKRLAGKPGGAVEEAVRRIIQAGLKLWRQEKKWWLIPLAITLLILAALLWVTQASSPLSPYMYPSR